MNILYVIGGTVLSIYGVWQTIKTAKVFMKGEQDKLGADIKILGAGIMFIIIGLSLILNFW